MFVYVCVYVLCVHVCVCTCAYVHVHVCVYACVMCMQECHCVKLFENGTEWRETDSSNILPTSIQCMQATHNTHRTHAHPHVCTLVVSTGVCVCVHGVCVCMVCVVCVCEVVSAMK